jgi:hypothetical protein
MRDPSRQIRDWAEHPCPHCGAVLIRGMPEDFCCKPFEARIAATLPREIPTDILDSKKCKYEPSSVSKNVTTDVMTPVRTNWLRCVSTIRDHKHTHSLPRNPHCSAAFPVHCYQSSTDTGCGSSSCPTACPWHPDAFCPGVQLEQQREAQHAFDRLRNSEPTGVVPEPFSVPKQLHRVATQGRRFHILH